MSRSRGSANLLLTVGCLVPLLLGACERLIFTPLPKEQGPQISVLYTILPIAGGTTLQVADTRIGQSADFVLTIRNNGLSPLELSGAPLVQIDDPAVPDQFSIAAQPAASSLASGATVQFTIRFQPDSEGVKNATITIPSNDAEVPVFTVDLAGRGYVSEPKITVLQGSTEIASGGSFDFGTTDVSSSLYFVFTIRNDGTEDLNLTGSPVVQVNDPADPDQFVANPQPAQNTLRPGQSTTFEIWFTPTTEGDKSATVSITSNDPVRGSFSFTVVGHITPPPEIAVHVGFHRDSLGGTYPFGTQDRGWQ